MSNNEKEELNDLIEDDILHKTLIHVDNIIKTSNLIIKNCDKTIKLMNNDTQRLYKI